MRLAIGAGIAAFVLYLVCLPTDVGWWDTAEFQTVPYIAGILHPTGFPAYTIAGWLITHVLWFGTVAWRMNVLSALATAIAAGVLARTARSFGCSALIALGAAALFATSTVIWSHATRAAVEALVLCFGSLATANGLAWVRGGPPRTLVLTALFAGLALATHPIALWFLPGLAVLALAGLRDRRRNGRTIAFAAAAFACALALYAYLPIRSNLITHAGLDPAASTLGIAGQPFWDYDHPANWAGVVREVTGADFGAAHSLGDTLDVRRLPSYIGRFIAVAVDAFGIAGALLALGIIVRLRDEPWAIVGLAIVAFGAIPFSVAYGFLVDASKYSLVAVWCLALAIAIGSDALARALTRLRAEIAIAPALILTVLITLDVRQNSEFFAQAGSAEGRRIIADVQRSVPDGAAVFAGWSYVTPLGYAAYVEHSLGTRIPITNIAHDQLAPYARKHALYYLPFPETELTVAGATLTLIPRSSPPIYRVTPSSSRTFRKQSP